ncbi:ribosome biogenesis GTPase Der [Kocuria carniphila]|uniref:ribosome biogenesis GTPase Der n=1 Tax=Kocuria carniphila TaxID=262208 RepID=UPI0021A9119F|nr:ribosome biogenesis GTPase Der [Kocuria carniphila]MCT1803615.1 ribosome biogenesis GTPase Der [Kocuria carniphila]
MTDSEENKVDTYEQSVLGGGQEDISERLAAIDDEEAERRAEALRAGLSDYELDEEDAALLDEWGGWDDDRETRLPDPVVAVVGRPNVGKSTLVNRVIGRREAVVEDTPGVTRDRVSYKAEWSGKNFTLVDTGGWEHDAKGIHARVAEQAEVAVQNADAVLLVLDVTVGVTATDEAVVSMLRRVKKPIILVANKADSPQLQIEASNLWSLGMGEPFPVSSLHGMGTGDALDALVKALPEYSEVAEPEVEGGPRRVALLGRPNVGKSSLLNKMAGSERVVVDELAGTTRDPVDEIVMLGDEPWRFIDTAGIRRRVHLQQGADFYASLRTQSALERAEVAVVLLAVDEVLSEQDVRILQMTVDSGRAVVLAFNKWDLLDDERRFYLEREIERDLAHVSWAPRVNISAKTGWHKDKLVPALHTALDSWDKRIPTGRLNAFLGELVAAHPHPVRGGKQPRILFGTQVSSRPPKFVLFTTGFLDPGYRRFIQRRLRETFGFEGTPIDVTMRVREKRQRKK